MPEIVFHIQVCLTLDNEQKSTGFDKRITWLSNEGKISLLLVLFWHFVDTINEFFYLSFIFFLFSSFLLFENIGCFKA